MPYHMLNPNIYLSTESGRTLPDIRNLKREELTDAEKWGILERGEILSSWIFLNETGNKKSSTLISYLRTNG
mgnify:CR=1 FL=1